MKYTSLDAIVSNVLMQIGKPIHWYVQCFNYSKDCLRELNFDDLRSVRVVKLQLNDQKAAPLPKDFVDYAKVGVMEGQLIRPLVPTESINRLINKDANCHPITYSGSDNENDVQLVGVGRYAGYGWTTNFNQYGEFVGRMYGAGAGYQTDVFQVIPERKQIQFSEYLNTDTVIMEYISDGMECDAATCVDAYAQETIENYVKWQLKENTRGVALSERQIAKSEYVLARKRLRARKNPLNVEYIRRIMQDAYYGSPKA